MIKIARNIIFALSIFGFSLSLYSCTPLVVGGALAGGAAAGYTARDKGYKVDITKEVKGSKKHKSSSDNSSEKGDISTY